MTRKEALERLEEAERLADVAGDRALRFEVLVKRAHLAWADGDAEASKESAGILLDVLSVCEAGEETDTACAMAVSLAWHM